MVAEVLLINAWAGIPLYGHVLYYVLINFYGVSLVMYLHVKADMSWSTDIKECIISLMIICHQYPLSNDVGWQWLALGCWHRRFECRFIS